jgi:hypothetical protein
MEPSKVTEWSSCLLSFHGMSRLEQRILYRTTPPDLFVLCPQNNLPKQKVRHFFSEVRSVVIHPLVKEFLTFFLKSDVDVDIE